MSAVDFLVDNSGILQTVAVYLDYGDPDDSAIFTLRLKDYWLRENNFKIREDNNEDGQVIRRTTVGPHDHPVLHSFNDQPAFTVFAVDEMSEDDGKRDQRNDNVVEWAKFGLVHRKNNFARYYPETGTNHMDYRVWMIDGFLCPHMTCVSHCYLGEPRDVQWWFLPLKEPFEAGTTKMQEEWGEVHRVDGPAVINTYRNSKMCENQPYEAKEGEYDIYSGPFPKHQWWLYGINLNHEEHKVAVARSLNKEEIWSRFFR